MIHETLPTYGMRERRPSQRPIKEANEYRNRQDRPLSLRYRIPRMTILRIPSLVVYQLLLFLMSRSINVQESIVTAQQLQHNHTACVPVVFIPFTDQREGPLEHDEKEKEQDHREMLRLLNEDHDHESETTTSVSSPTYSNYGYGSWPTAASLAKAAYSLLVAAELARHHFVRIEREWTFAESVLS